MATSPISEGDAVAAVLIAIRLVLIVGVGSTLAHLRRQRDAEAVALQTHISDMLLVSRPGPGS